MKDSLLKASDSSTSSMTKVKDSVSTSLSDASKSVDKFKDNVCFAHALENAVTSSKASMQAFTDLMNVQMANSMDHIKKFITACTAQFGYLGTLVSSTGDTFKAFVATIGNALADAAARSTAAMQNWVNMLRNSLDQGLSAIASFNASICFAHALAKAVDDSENTMKKWNKMMKDALTTGVNDIKTFNAQTNLSGATTGLSGISAPANAKQASPINITGPLVQIQGNADKATVDLAARQVMENLKSVVVEATSSAAPATSRRIRRGAVF